MKSDSLRGRRALAVSADRLPRECPECARPLETSRACFLLLGRTGEKALFNDDCSFCPGCNVVVLDADYIREVAHLSLPGAPRFAVGGFVDLDAVPEDKAHVPLGEPDNPIPFVGFASFEWLDRRS